MHEEAQIIPMKHSHIIYQRQVRAHETLHVPPNSECILWGKVPNNISMGIQSMCTMHSTFAIAETLNSGNDSIILRKGIISGSVYIDGYRLCFPYGKNIVEYQI